MTIAFDHVAGGKALAETRWHNRPAHEGKTYLAAVCMTGESKCDAIWNERKDVRVVRQQDHRSTIVFHSGQCSRDIVRPGPEITDAGDPY